LSVYGSESNGILARQANRRAGAFLKATIWRAGRLRLDMPNEMIVSNYAT